MTELSPTAKQTLHALRARDALDTEARARVRARIEASIAAGHEAALQPARLDARGLAIRIGLPIAIAAAVLLTLWAIAPRDDATRSRPHAEGQAAYGARPPAGPMPATQAGHPEGPQRDLPAAAPALAGDEATTVPDPTPEPAVDPVEPSAPRHATTPRPRSPQPQPSPSPSPSEADTGTPAPADTTLAEEMRLLRRARTAMRDDDPERALAALTEHLHTFADGQMAEDRDALRVEALCAVERTAEARQAAAAFARAWPRSPHTARVKKICAGE